MFAISVAILAYLLLGVAFLLDKYILTSAVERPVVYTAYSTIAMAMAFFLLPFTRGMILGVDLVIAIISGLMFAFGLWTFFLSCARAPITRMAPLNGAAVALFSVFFSFLLLGERFSQSVLFGTGLLVLSSVVIAFSLPASAKKNIRIALLWGVLSGACFGLSHVLAKLLYLSYDFWSVLVWSKAPAALLGAVLFVFPAVRMSGKKNTKKNKKNIWSLVFLNKAAASAGEVLIQVAVAMSSVSLIFSLSGIQFVFVFLGAIILTRFFPRHIQESVSARGVILLCLAFILLSFGLYFAMPHT